MRGTLPLILAMFLWSPSSHATNPSDTRNPRETVTVDFLYEACSAVGETAKGAIPHFDCESYVYGVLDAYLAVDSAIPKRQRACFPKEIPPWRVLEDAHSLIEGPWHDKAAASAIIEVLRRKYHCL